MNHTDLTNYLRSVSPAGQARNCLFVSKESLDIAEELHNELEEARKDPYAGPFKGVTPQSGDNSPHGWKKIRKGNRWVRKPITDAEAKAARKAYDKAHPGHWEEGERLQRKNPLNPDTDHLRSGPDDHLPGGAKAALERSRAAARRGVREGFDVLDEEEHKVTPAVQAIIDRMKKKALKGAKKKMRVVDARKPRPSGDDAYAGSNPSAMRHDPDMRNRGAVAEEVHEYRNGRKVNRLVPRGTDPYDILTKEGGKRGKAISMHGKLTKRLDSLSPETRAKYRRLYGYRTAMGRLYPMMEAKKIAKVKKALKGVVRDVKRAGKGFVKALGTPQSNTDYQITGRKF